MLTNQLCVIIGCANKEEDIDLVSCDTCLVRSFHKVCEEQFNKFYTIMVGTKNFCSEQCAKVGPLKEVINEEQRTRVQSIKNKN